MIQTNFQNVPRDDKVIKRAFLPKLECLVFADFSQIEPRTLAFFMAKLGDSDMADAYRRGEDVYRELAARMFSREPARVTEEQRQTAKRLFMSLMFGGGTKTVMSQGHSMADAKKLIRQFYDALPGIRLVSNPKPRDDRWVKGWVPGAIEEILEERGYIMTLYGRRLYPEQWGEHKMLSKLIQGTAADVMKQAMLRVAAGLRGRKTEAHMVSAVHDEIQLDCLKVDLPWLATELPRWMEDPIMSEVLPIPAEVEWTDTSWADKRPYDEEVT